MLLHGNGKIVNVSPALTGEYAATSTVSRLSMTESESINLEAQVKSQEDE